MTLPGQINEFGTTGFMKLIFLKYQIKKENNIYKIIKKFHNLKLIKKLNGIKAKRIKINSHQFYLS